MTVDYEPSPEDPVAPPGREGEYDAAHLLGAIGIEATRPPEVIQELDRPEIWRGPEVRGVSADQGVELRRTVLEAPFNGTLATAVSANGTEAYRTSLRGLVESAPAQTGLPPEQEAQVSVIDTNIAAPNPFNNFQLEIDGTKAELVDDELVRTPNRRNRSLEFTGKLTNGEKTADFKITTFLHYDRPHVGVTEIEITPQQDCEVTVKTGIDGDMPTDIDFYQPGGPNCKPLPDEKAILYTDVTKSGKTVAVAQSLHTSLRDENGNETLLDLQPTPLREGDRRYMQNVSLRADSSKTIVARNLNSLHSDADAAIVEGTGQPPAVACESDVAETDFAQLIEEHNQRWEDQWKKVGVPFIEGDPSIQEAVIHSVSTQQASVGADGNGYPYAMDPARRANSPREGYRGNGFWETETYTLQVATQSQAKEQMERRIRQIPAAREKAKDIGCEGIYFPWETSTVQNGEAGPDTLWSPTGPAHVDVLHSGVHINADVVYALNRFTDEKFSHSEGAAMLVEESARFYADRLTMGNDGKYRVLEAGGPDEYHADNDAEAYNQIMIAYTMRIAKELCDQNLIQISETERAIWDDIDANMYIPIDLDPNSPNFLRITPFKGWDDLEDIDLSQPPYQGIKAMDEFLQKEVLRDVASQHLQEQNDEQLKQLGLDDKSVLIQTLTTYLFGSKEEQAQLDPNIAAYLENAINAVRPNLTPQQKNPEHYKKVIKQPSVMLALVLLENKFLDLLPDKQRLLGLYGGDEDTLMRDIFAKNAAEFNPQTSHGSNLSPLVVMLSELLAGTDPDECYHKYLVSAGRLDLDDTDPRGLRQANEAALIWSIKRGFMGIKLADGEGDIENPSGKELQVKPRLPSHWGRTACIEHYDGNSVEVATDPANGVTSLRLIAYNENEKPLSVNIMGHQDKLSPQNPYIMVRAGQRQGENEERAA